VATRFYVDDDASPVSPAYDAGWEATGDAIRRLLARADEWSAVASGTQIIAPNGVANRDYLFWQGVSSPIAAQTISGTLTGLIVVREDATGNDARAQVVAKVVSADGSTVRGTLIAMDAGALANEFSSSFAAREFPRSTATTISSVAAQAGDRIVIEVGFRAHGTGVGDTRMGHNVAPDLTAVGEAGARGWVEFSGTIAFLKTGSDTGAGADAVSQNRRVGADTGSGADAGTLAVAHLRADTGAAIEALGSRTLAAAETGTGADDSEVEILVVAVETRPLPATLEEVLRGHHSPIARVLFLAADLDTVIHAIEATVAGDNRWLIGGDVTLDRARDIHRQGNVSLANRDGAYSPVDSSSLVWPNRIVRIERGARIGGVAQYAQLITGVVDDWAIDGSSGVVTFTVWSRLSLADGQFPSPLTFAVGTPIGTVVRALAELGGMGTTDGFYDLDDGGAALGDPRTFDTDDNILQAMIRLAFDNGLDLYDDGFGTLVLRPFVDPDTTTPVWTFRPGVDSTLTAASRTGKAGRVYNRAIVVGQGADRYPIRAEARVLNPDDPLYNPADGSGPVGDRPRPIYTSSDVTTQQAATATANRLLVEGALYEEALAAAAAPIPFLGARDVVRFTVAGVDDRYLLDQVAIPVGPGAMRMTTRRVRSLLA
jgi:hypothetical protein